ncbi:hypothetical protein AXK12_07455 [Cephaloticoccus capnophilus]|uniref:Uncharacterized protein n=1 Tax=Cephaloticoccus capnophilus TaxID=1548208 RepID=A0A139SIA3_9BACT|nr:hypothetical protein AXK12_07455 [Cephaloticoccus capnophilus]
MGVREKGAESNRAHSPPARVNFAARAQLTHGARTFFAQRQTNDWHRLRLLIFSRRRRFAAVAARSQLMLTQIFH